MTGATHAGPIMHLRIAVLTLALLFGAGPAGAAPLFSEAAAQLDGEWRGDDFVLKIDSRRAQASIDPARPFEWRHFLVKDVTDEEIVFTVGADLYEARIDADKLTLTSTSFRGERLLVRTSPPNDSNLRGTTAE